ncbi:class I SAM-dependent methyltransferase [Dokdonia sp.]|uniref:THUMP-like domain-containing protein n=1 Tax=Dokdonia sp. TaxID=2024995 RepID=UPI003264FD6C
MNLALVRPDVQEYLEEHLHSPIATFIFKGSPFPEITIQELAQQLEGKRRIKSKLPLWYETKGILFPPKVNIEQTSSQVTAQYKASLLKGESIIDITGGFGIDSYYFSKVIPNVTHVEVNEKISAFAKANFETLEATGITCITDHSIEYLSNQNLYFNTIYVDPGRRTDAKGKVFMLKDCLPNVPEHLDILLSKCTTLWIKTAPLLDIAAGLSELKNVSEIHIVAVKNEVKELLWCLKQENSQDVCVHTINIIGDKKDLTTFTLDTMLTAEATYEFPKSYLYEPNASLLKSGAFNWISNHYNIDKLQQNTQLYTSNKLISFPGRSFKINTILPYNKQFKKTLGIQKAHITTRNFGISVAELRKKFKISDGGDTYLFFTTLLDTKKVVLVCEKT